jgi:hypothetical protein
LLNVKLFPSKILNFSCIDHSVVFPSHDRRDAEQPVDASEAPEYGSSFEFSQPKSAALIDSLCAQNLCVDVVDIGPAGERVTLGT